MSIEFLLKESAARLLEAGFNHGTREAEIFLSHILDQDSAWILAHSEAEAPDDVVHKMDQLVNDRLNGRPIAYIVGNQSFQGWQFKSDPRALIPRPETEQLLETIVREIRQRHLDSGHFLELGTGSGVMAIGLKKYFPSSTVTATDVSEEALELAEENARQLKVDINFIESNLLAKVPKQSFDLIVANLPYVPTEHLAFTADQILDWEPLVAIDGGDDGLKYIQPLLETIKPYLKPTSLIALETWHTHGPAIKKLVKQHLPGFQVEIIQDLAAFDRFVIISPKAN